MNHSTSFSAPIEKRPVHLASGALPVGDASHSISALQDRLSLSWPIEALLADVVIRLRSSWVAGPAKCWAGIHPISELASTELDKRVATALCEGFSQFSQFLCGFEVLMLQRVNGSREFEETLLGIEQLFVHGPNYFHRLGLVPDGQSSFAEVNGAVDGGDGACNQREIHKSFPVEDEGCVRTPDSTACGNSEGAPSSDG